MAVTALARLRHCTTNGAGRRLSVCSKTAACSGSSRHSIFFSLVSSARRTHSNVGGFGAQRGHAVSQSCAHALASPTTRGTNFCTPSGRSRRDVNHARRPNVALERSLRRVTKSPSGQSAASTSGRVTDAFITATALAQPPTLTPRLVAFLGVARVATVLRSSSASVSTFIHWPSVKHSYVVLALTSLLRNSGETRAACTRCSPYCSRRWLSANTKKSLSPLLLRMGSRKKYISACLLSLSLPTRLCRDACAAPHFSNSLYVPSRSRSNAALSALRFQETLYSEKRLVVQGLRSLAMTAILDSSAGMPSVSCQLSTKGPPPSISSSNARCTGTSTAQSPSIRCLAPGATRMRATGCANTSWMGSSVVGAGVTITRHSGCASAAPMRSSRVTSSAPGHTYRAIQTSARRTSRNRNSAAATVSIALVHCLHVSSRESSSEDWLPKSAGESLASAFALAEAAATSSPSSLTRMGSVFLSFAAKSLGSPRVKS